MPFQNKGFWMENVNENSSRIETKRSHQWFLDGSDAESFPNKKQAVEIPNLNSFSGLLNSDMCSWGNPSGFAAQFNERLFDPEAARHVNFDDRNVPSSGIGSSMYTVRKDVDAPFGNDPLFGLSMSHAMEDPRLGLNYGGIRKVKVSQVKDSENLISVSMGDGYTRGDNNNSNIMTTAQAYSKGDENIISMGLSYDRGDDNILSIGDSFSQEGGNLMTMGQSYDKGDNNEISMNHAYKENDSAISIGGSVSKDENNGSTIGQTFSKGEGNMMSIGHLFEENNNGVSTDQTFDKGDSNITLTGQAFTQGKSNTVLRGHCYNEVGGSTNHLSLGHSFSRGESNIISFGGCNDDDDDISPSGRVICSYELLMGHQRPEAEKGSVDTNADVGVNDVQATVSVTKNREEQKATKKAPQNNFPSNVRSLLSTGMLDEVPVKYIAWSREKELRGVIKGSGYLCGCQSCNFSKAINAYEFERHAGCKTKHPNNHIYFENGKTIYGIVQELRSTPQHLLFDVIQTITGSPINQKSFRLWKESFLAATRELQRIYGKEEVKQLS